MTKLTSKTPFRVANILSASDVIVGYGVLRTSELGGQDFVATTMGTSAEKMALMQAEADRLNKRDGHPLETRIYKRLPVIFKGIDIDPVGDAEWAARFVTGHGPARNTPSKAYEDRFA